VEGVVISLKLIMIILSFFGLFCAIITLYSIITRALKKDINEIKQEIDDVRTMEKDILEKIKGLTHASAGNR
jgi:hypothetical protein